MFVIMNARVSGDPTAPRKRNPQLTPQVEEIILHAMEREPGKRYQNAAAMKGDLDKPAEVALTGRCERLKAPSAWKQGGREWLWITLGISAAVIILVLLVLLIIKRGPAQ